MDITIFILGLIRLDSKVFSYKWLCPKSLIPSHLALVSSPLIFVTISLCLVQSCGGSYIPNISLLLCLQAFKKMVVLGVSCRLFRLKDNYEHTTTSERYKFLQVIASLR